MEKTFLFSVITSLTLLSCGGKGTTDDLAFFSLKGDVKKMDGVEFDQNGKITRVGGYDPFAVEEPTRSFDEQTAAFTDIEKWTRDNSGRICSQDAMEYHTVYVWDGSKIIRDTVYCEGQVWLDTYEYDGEGNVKKITSLSCEDNDGLKFEPDHTVEYIYKDFDSHKNWTKRVAKTTDAATNDTSEDEETRNIEYYN